MRNLKVLLLTILIALAATTVAVALAWTNPSNNPPSGAGVLNFSGGNVGIGGAPGYKFDVQGGQINSSGGLCIAGDCKTAWSQVGGGSITSAANVSSGSFGANTGGGNYTFPANVGIGTTGPSSKLELYDSSSDVQLTINTAGGTPNPIIFLKDGDSATLYGFKMWYDNDVGSTYFDNKYNSDVGNIYFRTKVDSTPVNALTILGSGSVGIGTAAPATGGAYNPKLDVRGDTFITAPNDTTVGVWLSRSGGPTSGWNATGGTWGVYRSGSGASDAFHVGLAGVNEPFTITTGGNVGIGTTVPGQKLSVAGTIESTSGGFKFPDATVQTTAATGGGTINAANVSAGSFGANTGGGNYTFPSGGRIAFNGSSITSGGAYGVGNGAAYNNLNSIAVDTLETDGGVGGGGTLELIYYGGSAVTVGSGGTKPIYASQFIDGNGSTYYVDPASTSNLNAANFAGSVGITGAISGAAYGGMITVAGGGDSWYGMGGSTSAGGATAVGGYYPYAISNHTGLAFSAHSSYGGIRFYNQNYPTAPMTATPVMDIINNEVGIGTGAPSYKLDVQGGQMNASGGLCINGSCITAWSQAGGGSTISAANVSAGSFGANTGGGNYTFPGNVNISGAYPNGVLTVPSSYIYAQDLYSYSSGKWLSQTLSGSTSYIATDGWVAAWTGTNSLGTAGASGLGGIYITTGAISPAHVRVAINTTTNYNYDLQVNGSFAATSKSFDIQDPRYNDPTKRLVHATLEGPEDAVFYRGEGKLVNGKIIITLPDYFEALTRKENRTVLLTPEFDSDTESISQLAASAVISGKFTVRNIDQLNPSQKFFWEVKAVRSDIAPLQVEIEKATQ